MQNLGNSFANFILYPQFEGFLLLVKIIFILLSLVFLAVIFLLLFNTNWMKRYVLEDFTETFTARPYGSKKIYKDWLMIKERFFSHREKDQKLAIIEADDLLNDIFKKMGYKGENMTERLSQIDSKTLSNIDEVNVIHKVRNNIVHNPDFKIEPGVPKKAFEVFEKSLRELEVF